MAYAYVWKEIQPMEMRTELWTINRIIMKQLLWVWAACVLGLGCMSCSTDEPLWDETETTLPSQGQPEGEEGSGDGTNEENNNGNTNEPMNRNILISVGGQDFSATLEDNETARAFLALLPMTVTMTEMNGNEKYYNLPQGLPTDTFRPGTIQTGDLLLWGSNTVVLFYETFSSGYSYTRLGRIGDAEGLASAVGSGNVSVTFSLR